MVERYLGVVEVARSNRVTQTSEDSYEQVICPNESYFLLKKLCIMHYFIHIRVIKANFKTQKSQREIEFFTAQTLFFHF